MSGFSRFKQAEAVEVDTTRCPANGCPCRASVSIGGAPSACSFHAHAESRKWPQISAGLRDHDWLIGFIRDLRPETMYREWRDYATKFWQDAEPAMVPTADESREMYLYRLHLSLGFRVHARDKAPGPLIPAGKGLQKRSAGNVAELVA